VSSLTVENPTLETKYHADPYMRLAPLSKVLRSDIETGLVLGDYSCVNRSAIGKYSGMGCFSYVADSVVGNYCTFASRVSVGAFEHPTDWLSIHEFQYRDVGEIYGDSLIRNKQNNLSSDDRPTVIGSDVWIGDNATVRRSVRIGHGAIIGMSSVVTRDVAPYSIVVGNPARHLRYRFDADIRDRLLNLEWWQLDMKSLKGIEFNNIERAVSVLEERKDAAISYPTTQTS
jgi:virginiamycin A acetyltransferase